MHRRLRLVLSITLTIALALTLAHSAWASPPAHDAPQGSEWVMADWMFLSFILFAGVAFISFLLALKAGLLSNLEDAKYYILEIEEQDYYDTTEWTRDGDDS